MTAAFSTTREIVAFSILVTMAAHKLTGKQGRARLLSAVLSQSANTVVKMRRIRLCACIYPTRVGPAWQGGLMATTAHLPWNGAPRQAQRSGENAVALGLFRPFVADEIRLRAKMEAHHVLACQRDILLLEHEYDRRPIPGLLLHRVIEVHAL